MSNWQAPLSLPPQLPPAPFFEPYSELIPLTEELSLYTRLIIDPDFEDKSYKDPNLNSEECTYEFAYSSLVTSIVNTAIKGRIPQVDSKGRLVFRERLPERVTNYHHLFYRHNIRSGDIEDYPLIDILFEDINLEDPYTHNPIWREEDIVINMMRLERIFHMRIHGGRNKLEYIKTNKGNIPTNDLLLAFALFNLADRKLEIVAKVTQSPYWHKSKSIQRALWYLDIAEKMANKVATKRPDLLDIWINYVEKYSQYEQ